MTQSSSNKHRNWYAISGQGLALMVIVFCIGCAPLSKMPEDWFSFTEKEETVVPDRVLPIWTDTVLHQPGQKGVRGFGGRVYFYKQGTDQPVPVDGNLTVYVFDGDYFANDATMPLKKYIVTADQMKDLASTSQLGVSYNIWLPWEEVGGTSKKLNLIARFDGINGGTVISNSATKLLPGIDTPENHYEAESHSEKQATGLAVLPASFVEDDRQVISKAPQQSDTTIFSIDLPSSLERKINSPSVVEPDAQTKVPTRDITIDPQVDSQFWNLKTSDAANPENGPRPGDSASDSTNRAASRASQTTVVGHNGLFRNSTRVSLGKVGTQARVTGDERRSGFAHRRFRAQNEPEVQQESSLLRLQPHPATWQSGLKRTPRSNR